MVLFWFVLAVLLIAVELSHFAFFALFGAIGALAAAGVAWVAPDAVALQVIVAVVVAVVGIIGVRPMMSKALHIGDSHGERLGRGVHGSLVGEIVLTLDTVGGVGKVGHVKLAGERWLATSAMGDTIPEGTRVRVMSVEGTTLVVTSIDDTIMPADPPTPRLDPTREQPEGDQP